MTWLARTPEPELMDDVTQALAYAKADFDEPNAAFLELVGCHASASLPGRVVDLGCGPGDIAVALAQRWAGSSVVGVDGSRAMLAHAHERATHSAVEVVFVQATLQELPSLGQFDVVVSNSLLHHLSDPAVLWRVIKALGRPGAQVVVMDLTRPQTAGGASQLVAQYSGDEPPVLQRDFLNSLHAAFRVEEVRDQLLLTGMDTLQVGRVSDRHLAVWGALPGHG